MTSTLTRKDTPTPHQTPGERQKRSDICFPYPIGNLSFTFSLNSYSGVSSPTSSTITTRSSRYLLILDIKVSKTWEVTWSPIPYLFEQVWRHSFRSILHEELLCEVWQVKKKKKKCLTCPPHLDACSGGFPGFGRILPLQCIPNDMMKYNDFPVIFYHFCDAESCMRKTCAPTATSPLMPLPRWSCLRWRSTVMLPALKWAHLFLYSSATPTWIMSAFLDKMIESKFQPTVMPNFNKYSSKQWKLS